MPDGEFSIEDPGTDDVRRMVERHLAFARAATPPEDAHALDLDGLRHPSVTLIGYRVDGELLAIGALKHLDSDHAELKSMHTAEAARGTGIGRRVLNKLLTLARDRGYHRVSLETGSMAEFAAARRLYESAGFAACEPFGDYRVSRNSAYMTLEL